MLYGEARQLEVFEGIRVSHQDSPIVEHQAKYLNYVTQISNIGVLYMSASTRVKIRKLKIFRIRNK